MSSKVSAIKARKGFAAAKLGAAALLLIAGGIAHAGAKVDTPEPGTELAYAANGTALQPSRVDELLRIHNRYRGEVGVPPLRWSDTLAAGARDWAEKLAREGRFEHSAHNREQPQYGENLALSTGEPSATDLVELWGGEKSDFIAGARFPNIARSGDWASVGHYSQLVWRASTEVGCGIRRGAVATLLVCRYAPAGNWIGEIPY